MKESQEAGGEYGNANNVNGLYFSDNSSEEENVAWAQT